MTGESTSLYGYRKSGVPEVFSNRDRRYGSSKVVTCSRWAGTEG